MLDYFFVFVEKIELKLEKFLEINLIFVNNLFY